MPTQIYKVDGQRVPSVTTVLGQFKDPGPLMYWSWKVANDVLEEALDVLEKIQTQDPKAYPQFSGHDFMMSNPLERANFRSQAKKAADTGTICHKLVDLWIHGDISAKSNLSRLQPEKIASLEGIAPQMAERVHNSFQAFLSWADSCRFKLLQTELPLISQKHHFGGTIDCIGSTLAKGFDKKFQLPRDTIQKKSPPRALVVCDWKTSKGLYMEYICQIAAYKMLWDENNTTPIACCHLIRFDKETGDFHHHQFTNLGEAERLFLLFREAYTLAQELKKRIK